MSTLNDSGGGGKTSVELALETLKPIRDLGKNWDIDISSCLEEFLRDLVGDKHVADAMLIEQQRGGGGADGEEEEKENGDHHPMGFSFTEAALVLDSSSKVYSRKVEYLHQLVFKALDGLASTSTQLDGNKKKNKRSRAAPSPDIQDFLDHDPEQEFLLLDDVLPTDEAGGCRHINLPSEQLLIDQQAAAASSGTAGAGRSTSVEIARRGGTGGAQSSAGGGGAGLSMMNRTARNSTFQKENNRSSIGSAALQTLIGSAASATAGHSSLRLMRVHGCTIDASGALVMPGGRQHSYNNKYDNVPAEQTPANEASTRMSYPAMSTGNDGVQQNVDVGGLEDDNHGDDGGGFAMMDDDHDDDGGPGFAMVDNDDTAAAADAAAMPPPSFRKKGVTFSSDLPSHKGNEGQAQPAQGEQEQEEEEDPWKLLDPHLPATEKKHKPRPLVVGMTLQLPPDVDELPSEAIARRARGTAVSARDSKRNKKLKVPKIKTQKVDTSCNRDWAVDTFRANLKRAQASAAASGRQDQSSSVLEALEAEIDQPHIPLTGLFYGNEFEYIAKASAKRKAAEKRERLQQQQQEQSLQQRQQRRNDADDLHHPQAPAAELMQDVGNDDYKEHDDDGGFGFGDHDDGDDNDDDYGDFGGGFQDDGGDDNNANNNDGKVATNTGITVVDQAYQTSTLDDDNDSTMNDRDFAALCRARIEQFAKGAEKYASDTQLSKRVAKWQSKVKPMLENEEKRPAFDIHAYSLKILESMDQDLKQQQQEQGVEQDEENADENMAEQDDLRPGDKDRHPRSVNFAHVTQDCEQFDVCRMFLASLSLCNAGNIAVRQDVDNNATGSVDDGMNRPRIITSTLQLELLSSEISKPMDVYLDL